MDILKKINKMRIDRNWSVYRLSLESEIPQSTITNMFNRETLPSITTLECICKAFGITMSDFFKDEADLQTNYNDELFTLFNNLDKEAQNDILNILRKLNGK